MMAIRLRVNNHKKAGKLSVAVGDGVGAGAGDPSRGRFCVFSGVAVFKVCSRALLFRRFASRCWRKAERDRKPLSYQRCC